MKQKHKLYTLLLLPLIFLQAVSSTGCSIVQKEVEDYGFYFDTIIRIQLYGTDNSSYIDSCFELADYYENLLSNTKSDSDITRINENAGSFVTVNDDTIEVLKQGIYYGELSDGKFDITIGKLSDLWNISKVAAETDDSDNEVDASYIPSDDKIKEYTEHINYKNIIIKNNQVMLTDKESKIDLGGIAKGYIADKMKTLLVDQGITSGIISLGGNILTIGAKNEQDGFTIGIQKPFAEKNEVIAKLQITDQSVVSSGIDERYFKVNNQIYHHILDSKTGYPINNSLYEVTIISDKSIDGDALSTYCYTLGLDDALSFIENNDSLEAIFVTDSYEVIYSSGLNGKVTIL